MHIARLKQKDLGRFDSSCIRYSTLYWIHEKPGLHYIPCTYIQKIATLPIVSPSVVGLLVRLRQYCNGARSCMVSKNTEKGSISRNSLSPQPKMAHSGKSFMKLFPFIVHRRHVYAQYSCSRSLHVATGTSLVQYFIRFIDTSDDMSDVRCTNWHDSLARVRPLRMPLLPGPRHNQMTACCDGHMY